MLPLQQQFEVKKPGGMEDTKPFVLVVQRGRLAQ